MANDCCGLLIFARSAGPEILLNCSILGPNVARTFSVKILRDESVDVLKYAIKEKKKPKLDHMSADELDLWKVSDLMHNVPDIGDNVRHGTFAAPGSPSKR